MAALEVGTLAPDFTLSTLDGRHAILSELLTNGPVVLAFFKISCPVCQYAFPLYDRIAQGHKDVTVLGVSQNGATDTKKFVREYGLTFPVAIDDASHYTVSNAYGLTNVPTLYYISQTGNIEVSSVGWSKSAVDEVNVKLAIHRHETPAAIWQVGEEVPAFRAG